MTDIQSFQVVDGNTAAATVAYLLSDICFIYPITPSSSMGEKADDYSAAKKKNIFGNVVEITQMQSEGGVAGALHGSILSGALCTTFTCSQGLLLMIPEMLKLAGELQPVVMHVSTRTVGAQAMNIYSDHSDIMTTRATGWAMLGSNTVQQVADLAVVAHVATVRAQVPFQHFFEGFRVSHEMQKILFPTQKTLELMIEPEAIRKWRNEKPLKNNNPTMRALVDNVDMYYQLVEAGNSSFDKVPDIVQDVMNKYAKLTGRQYHLFDFIGDADAEYVVVALGTCCATLEEYVTHPDIKSQGHKLGVIAVHLFHPFSIEAFEKAIPKTTKRITILDRTKEYGSAGEPLYLECLAALQQSGRLDDGKIRIHTGRYCLGGRDVTPTIAAQVYKNMISADKEGIPPKIRFSVGLIDDVTKLSLPPHDKVTLPFPSTTQSLFYGFGADGTVGSIKNAIQIIGDNTDLYSQAHFVYDAKKSGGVTITHVRFGHSPITSQYEIQDADYLACHHPSYVRKYDMLNYSKEGSVFVLNGPWENVETLSKVLPYQMKKAIVQKKLKFYVINAEKIAASVGLPGRVNNVMQTVFFYLSEVIKPIEQAIEFQKKAIEKTFKKKGMQVVEQNWKCVDSSVAALIKIDPPKDWGDEEGLGKFDEIPVFPGELPPFFKNVAGPVLALKGEELKVSDLMLYKGGILPTDTARYEKRNVSANVPIWDEQKCVQCNLCSFLCPHASIRPYLVREKEAEEATTLFSTKPSSSSSPLPSSPYKLKYAKQKGATNSIAKIIVDEEGKEIIRKQGEEGKGEKEEELLFAISVTTADCMGCTICVGSCPAKALAMQPNLTAESFIEQDYFDYLSKLPNRAHLIYNEIEEEKKSKEKGDAFLSTPAPNSKNLSFKQPLLEFSGACAGCAESTLAKVVTQLVGKRMVVATACGCSMVWGGTEPSCAYSIDRDTQLGPTYTGSLFEDTSELALGLAVGGIYMRDKLKKFVQQIVSQEQKKEEENEKDIVLSKDLLNSFAQWLNEYENPSISVSLSLQINSQLKKITGDVFDKIPIMKEIQSLSDLFLKKSYWCFGGDGFAYDIGFGGLDQVLQMGVNLNILIYDTEVYSNTGGQKSKSTPRGAIARFAAAGKETQKKDLGLYAVGLRCCYVANIAQGANPLQTVKALHEAEEFPGTSIVIALCPCINWGLKGGQSKSVEEQKLAVKTGYWPLFRYNPLLSKEGKNPFILDSAAPSDPVSKLLERETRFDSLKQQSPETAKLLHEGLQRDIDDRYKRLAAMAKGE